MRRKTFFFNIVLLIFSVCSTMMLLEVLIRIWYPQVESAKWIVLHKKYGKFQRKNFVGKYVNRKADNMIEIRTNSLGLRDKEYDLSDTESKRILLIGDSFTFGWGLAENAIFSTKLDSLLNESLGRYIVINAGVPDWGTIQETEYAKDHFALFRPDIIILTFCGNDIEGDQRYRNQLKNDFQGNIYFPGKTFLRVHSHLYRLLRRKLSAFYAIISSKKRSDEGGNSSESFVDEQTGYQITEPEWRQTADIIRQFNHECLAFNPKGVLIIQATAPWNQEIRKRLASLENGENLFFVDLYEDTKNLTREERRLPHDGHWPENIHTISAKRLFDKIREIEALQ